jgi:molybdate/tungstate transport system ATP-binding protein
MLRLQNICKSYLGFSLKDICLEVEKGDYFVLLGKSGSGKSMLLEIISGLRTQDTGAVILNNTDISRTRIQNRNIILVYQDTALFPHLTVYENIAFTLKSHKINTKKIPEIIAEMASFVSVEHLLRRMPANLSGGEAQRVALARALVVQPQLLLLDEPLSSLDIHLKDELLSLLRKINRSGQTIIHVTHDFEETVSLSNKVAVIDNGSIIQSGMTEDVFLNPRNDFVAGLSGVKNFFRATILPEISEDGLCLVQAAGCDIKIRIMTDSKVGSGYLTLNTRDIFLSLDKPDNSSVINNFKGIVTDVIPRGNGMEVVVDAGLKITALISKASFQNLSLQLNKTVWIGFKATACRFIPSS